jgi:hypothetical protein
MHYTINIRFTIDEKHFGMAASSLYQLMMVLTFSLFSLNSIKNARHIIPPKKVHKIETINLTRKTIQVVRRRRSSVGRSKKRISKTGSSLDSFLSNTKMATTSKKSFKSKKIDPLKQKGKDLKNLIDMKASDASFNLNNGAAFQDITFESDQKKKKNSKRMSADLEHVKETLRDNYVSYTQCYDKALLKDSTISGKANLRFHISGNKILSTKVTFVGEGKKNSIRTMSDCIKLASKRVRFEQEQLKKYVKYLLLLGS